MTKLWNEIGHIGTKTGKSTKMKEQPGDGSSDISGNTNKRRKLTSGSDIERRNNKPCLEEDAKQPANNSSSMVSLKEAATIHKDDARDEGGFAAGSQIGVTPLQTQKKTLDDESFAAGSQIGATALQIKKKRLDDEWLSWWELLRDYKEEKGHFPVKSAVYRGKKLGVWVNNQRKRYAQQQNGKFKPGSVPIADWRIAKLNDLAFEWALLEKWDWLAWWELLRDYKEEKGNLPVKSVVYRGKKLGIWVKTQRQHYWQQQNGKLEAASVQMTAWRIAKLNELEFDWAPKRAKDHNC